MAPRRCLICGSRRWRKNAVGLVTCNEGHVLQHYVNESGEVDDIGPHMMRKRTLKSVRKKKEKKSSADPKLYHGDRARFHYYQCLQLLLRKQIVALMSLWNLPPEFETICRDLWVFHLNLIPNALPAEPFHHARDQEGYQFEPGDIGKRARSGSNRESAMDSDSRDSNDMVPGGNSSSSEEETFAPEIAVLVEENSDVSSPDDGSSDDEPRARNSMYAPSKGSFVSRADRPENTIALLVLACWSIRLPVVYMDFIHAIESYSLPYLDHVRSFPSSLTRHLTKHAVQALSPRHAPNTLSLHRLTSRLANQFYDTFDISIPGLNTAPVLWRIVQECFGGILTLYILTKRVRSILSVGLSLYGSSMVPVTNTENLDGHKCNGSPPEVSLLATAIVVLKLVYGLDGKQRLPNSSGDVACGCPAVAELLAAVKGADHTESCNSHRFGSRVPVSVGDLDDTALDEYLDFCQRVLVDPKKDEHRVIDNYFSLASEAADLKRGKPCNPKGQRLSSTRKNDGKMGILEPGEKYTIYDAKDVLGKLPDELTTIVEQLARWAGVDSEFVCGVVERYERRLVRWWSEENIEGMEGDKMGR